MGHLIIKSNTTSVTMFGCDGQEQDTLWLTELTDKTYWQTTFLQTGY